MKKFFGYIRNTIIFLALLYVTSIFVDIKIEGVPLNSLYENAAKETYKLVEDLIDRIRKEPEVTELKIERTEEGQYIFTTTIKNVSKDELISITVDGVTYTTFEIIQRRNLIEAKFLTDVVFDAGEANKQFTVESIRYTRNDSEQILNTNIIGNAFKSIDLAIVNQKKISVIGMYNCNPGNVGLVCTSWGSGVLFRKDTRQVTDSLIPYTIYDYYILSNAHVVQNGSVFRITYNGEELDERATVVGVYTQNTDLSILKLTTTVNLTVLDDDQFDTYEAVPVYKNQTVFSIGSPVGPVNFNTVKEGIVTKLDVPISLGDESAFCIATCDSFQTNAALGPGSSGGAMFDSAGNLIGIHFAGNEGNTISSEIPMEIVFDAIKAILGED